MASSLSPCLCLLLVATASIVVGAVNEYKVGDSDGWRAPAENDPGFYETCASKIQFLVGDSICQYRCPTSLNLSHNIHLFGHWCCINFPFRSVFEYKNDSVVKVSKRGYYHCNETKQGSTFREGSTVFLLDKPGFYYFVSGDLEHCRKGQRLMVEVVGVPLPLVPSPSPLPSAAVSSTISSLLTAFAIGTWCLSLVFIHFSRLF